MNDPEILASLISGAATVLSAMITVFGAWLVGRIIANRRKLMEDLEEARNDIAYLLAVEAAHCAKHQKDTGESHKLRIRRQVEQENPGLCWTGRNTPGRTS